MKSLSFKCSTPYGITAEVTPGVARPRRPPKVLNAFRHHGGGHIESESSCVASSRCSTPYGITAEVTRGRPGRASDRASVLNALRHHGGGHPRAESVRRAYDAGCSTPYGITAEVTASQLPSLAQLGACSTPYGITAEVTLNVPSESRLALQVLNALRHHGGGHGYRGTATAGPRGCSTPYGITAEVTPAYTWPATRRRSAQRLTASRRRSPQDLRDVGRHVHVLNALRHHGGGHMLYLILLRR